MVKRFRYRIYPNPEQEEVFQKNFGCCRFVYNWALDLRIKHYEEAKALQIVCDTFNKDMVVLYHLLKRNLYLKELIKIDTVLPGHLDSWTWTLVRAPKIKQLSSYDLSQMLTQLKKKPEYSWLKEVNSISLNTAISHLETAFANFFRRLKKKETPGFPKFKSKHKSGKSFSFHQAYTVDFDRKKIKLMKVGEIPAVFHRRFEGDYKTATILQEPSGKYYISIVVKNDLKEPSLLSSSIQNMVGIDHGVAHALTLSDGHVFNTDIEFEKLNRQLVGLQRSLARKEKGSESFKKNKIKVAIKHEKIRHSRQFIIEKLIVDLIRYLKEKNYTSVAIRKYNVEKLVRKIAPVEEPQQLDSETGVKKYKRNGRSQQRQLNKRILNAALGMVFQQLRYKCSLEGINCIELDVTEEKTTNKCSHCGEESFIRINKTSREFECKKCGFTNDMDVNAAKNCVHLAAKSFTGKGVLKKAV